MSSQLAGEFDYYLGHQDELAEKHGGKVVVIKGREVIGVYEDSLTAVTETSRSHELGTFLIQEAGHGPEAHTHVFRSRVAFNDPTS